MIQVGTTSSLKQPDGNIPPTFNDSSGIAIQRFGDRTILSEMQALIDFYFSKSVADYTAMNADDYHEIILAAQEEANRRQLVRRITHDLADSLRYILGSDNILIQSNLYLRATRPSISKIQEAIGWHRESFYGPDVEHAVNLWMPVANVTIDSTLRYVPGSHTIPDDKIETVSEADETVARFSSGHRIGLLYSPKRIVSGVDFSAQRSFVVMPGEIAIFSSQLIHGSAKNYSDRIRFSVDFRAIAAENLKEQKQHYTSGKNYFEPL